MWYVHEEANITLKLKLMLFIEILPFLVYRFPVSHSTSSFAFCIYEKNRQGETTIPQTSSEALHPSSFNILLFKHPAASQ